MSKTEKTQEEFEAELREYIKDIGESMQELKEAVKKDLVGDKLDWALKDIKRNETIIALAVDYIDAEQLLTASFLMNVLMVIHNSNPETMKMVMMVISMAEKVSRGEVEVIPVSLDELDMLAECKGKTIN